MTKLKNTINDFWSHLCHKSNDKELPEGNSLSLTNEVDALIPEETPNSNDRYVDVEEKSEGRATQKNPIISETNITPEYDFIRQQTYVKKDKSLVLGVSIRGKSHIDSNTDCQDFHLYQEMTGGWSILVVSDGAGSAKFAGRGSKANCTISMKLLVEMITVNKWIEKDALPSELEWYIEFRNICEKMKSIYQNKVADMNDGTVETDFNATLLVSIITPYGLLSGHIGDGRMGYLAEGGEWRSLMKPHKGEEGNQTLFLQNNWNKPHVPALKVSDVNVPETRIILDNPQAVVLISDGCERSCWECSIMDANIGKFTDVNKPHPEFMNPLINSILAEDEEERLKLFIDIIDKGTKSCEAERDDKTMLIALSNVNYGISDLQERESC